VLQGIYRSLISAPLVSVHIATFLFGLAGVLGAAVDLGAIEVTFARTLFASLTLFIVCRGMNAGVLQYFPPGSLLILFFSGALLAFHWVAFFASIRASTVAIGLVTFSTCPVFVALLEPLFFKEKWRIETIAAALLVLLGVLVISGIVSGEFNYGSGILFGLASGFSFAILQLLNRRLTHSNGALVTAFIQNSVATVVLLPLAFFGFKGVAANQWIILLILGVVCTAFAHTLFINALRQVSVSVASLIAAGLEPVYGVLLALLILSQLPSANVIVGGLIILITVLGVTLRNHKSKSVQL